MKRVALITGGSRGIGFGISQCLAREGLDLAICGMRSEERVQEALEQLRGSGSEVLYCQADVGNKEMRKNLLRSIKDRYGRLHVLVNNAGVAPLERKDALEATEESFERVLRINLQGPHFLTQLVSSRPI